MTPADRRAALVERMVRSVEARGEGITFDAVELCLDIALEEAAKVVTEHYQELCTEHRLLLVNRAAAIRSLKSVNKIDVDKSATS